MKCFIPLLISSLLIFSSAFCEIERRAAIDVGSGGTKLTIAEIETDSNKILSVLYDTSFPVPYQASLDKSQDGTFDEETKALGLKTFKEIQTHIINYEVKKTSAVATSAFRKANNNESFVKEIEKQTSIKVGIIPQKEEGEIAFFSALINEQFNSDNIIVLDVGTGSLQMTTTNETGLTVYMGENMGSVAFKYYIIDTIQDWEDNPVDSPNPISEEDLKMADSYARAFARRAFPIIKQKIKDQGTILGIGRLFYHSIRPIAAEDGVITRKGLRQFIYDSLDKTDEELNNPFAHVDVSNCILILAIMKALHIQEIHPIDTTTTKGILLSPSYWE